MAKLAYKESWEPFWLLCEVFHVLSDPTICFYKAAPLFPPIHFTSSCLSFHPVSASFPLHFSCCHSPSFFATLYHTLPSPPLSIFPEAVSVCILIWSFIFFFSVVSCSQYPPHSSLLLHFLRVYPSFFPRSLLPFPPFVSPLFTSLFLPWPYSRGQAQHFLSSHKHIQ